jgi:hypothetical protein
MHTERAEAFLPPRVTTTAADYRCSRRRSAGGDGGTTLFRSVSSDEDGGNPANIAASGSEQSNTARLRGQQSSDKNVAKNTSDRSGLASLLAGPEF